VGRGWWVKRVVGDDIVVGGERVTRGEWVGAEKGERDQGVR
jgi:hypothetical protein